MKIASIILLGILFGVLEVSVILWLVSRFGGWHQLARQFPCERPPPERLWRWQSISLGRAVHYSGIITMGIDPVGLYLALPWIFNVGHRPFLVPWHEMQLERKRPRWGGEYLEIRFPNLPNVVLRLPARTVRHIALELGTMNIPTATISGMADNPSPDR